MADLTGTPTYLNTLRQLEPTDAAHPNTWNPNYQALLNNDAFLKQVVDALSTSNSNHANSTNNPHGVTAAQVGAATASHTHSANDLPKASTSGAGIVQLTDSVTSTSTTLGVTASALKTVMDRANEAFTQAGDGKSLIATAVTAKGVSASPADTFAQLATKIGQISTGVKTATGQTGTIHNNGTLTVSGLDFLPSIILLSGYSSQYTHVRAAHVYASLYQRYSGWYNVGLNNDNSSYLKVTSLLSNGFQFENSTYNGPMSFDSVWWMAIQ